MQLNVNRQTVTVYISPFTLLACPLVASWLDKPLVSYCTCTMAGLYFKGTAHGCIEPIALKVM